LDIFKVIPTTVGVQTELDQTASMMVAPNPTAGDFTFQYNWENAGTNPSLEIHNLLGQIVYNEQLTAKNGVATFGHNLNAGIYLASLRSAGHSSIPVKLVKQ
jgi:hypothetical protein